MRSFFLFLLFLNGGRHIFLVGFLIKIFVLILSFLNFSWLLRRIHRLTDWAITETTLDECFLKVTRRVHAEEDGLVRRVGRTLSTACREEIN